MTKFYSIVALALAAMSCATAPKTTVSIHVDGKQTPSNVVLMTSDSTYTLTLDSTKTASVALAENLQAGYATVRCGRIPVSVYVEPGKSFDLSLQIQGYSVTPTFTGEGAAKNTYLNSDIFTKNGPDFRSEEDAFIKSLEELESSRISKLESEQFDSQFVQKEKKRIHYLTYSAMPMYLSYHPYYAQDQAYTPSDRFYEVMQAAISEEPSLIDMDPYLQALSSATQILANKDTKEYNPLLFLKNQLAYIQEHYQDPAIVEYLVDQYVMEYVKRYGVDEQKEFIDIYNSKVTSPKKQAEFKALCEKWARIAKGQPAPAFKYLDINGKEVSLSDLAGKYVYIDVWATWCGPCRGEIPHLQKLEHKYADKNIHFVSISCDQDKGAWEKMVKEDKLGGIQLHNGGDHEFMNTFMITGIPRFILLDKEGKILNANMTRPSNIRTSETFDSLEGI